MLQRIYGTAWRDQKELDEYLKVIEEAEKRDHRKIGKDGLYFTFKMMLQALYFGIRKDGQFSKKVD